MGDVFITLQHAAAHASAVATQIGTHVTTTIRSLNLPSYIAPVFPLIDQLSHSAVPYIQRASAHVMPLLAPYTEPFVKGARPHLDKISHAEFALVVGGLLGGVFLLQLLLLLTSTCRRGSSRWKAFTPTVFWLLLCTLIHSWIEFTFVFNRRLPQMINSMNLYGAADFRYGLPDSESLELEAGTAAMEAITALVTGPLCLLLAWAIVGNKSWRWSVQVVVCTCQMYGLAWFMTHPFFLADKISSNDPFLYWVIFVGFNAPWGIVPPIMLIQALYHINKALAEKAHNSSTTAVAAAPQPQQQPQKPQQKPQQPQQQPQQQQQQKKKNGAH